MSILNFIPETENYNGVMVDMFKKIVEQDLGYNYMYGHPTDVLQRLQELDKDPVNRDTKYPVIILLQDFPEANNNVPGIDFEAGLHFIIATLTEPTYRAPERYTKNFKPTLYPMYKNFKEGIFDSGFFMLISPDQIPHTKLDRVFWGQKGLYGVDGNIFNDKIDAIEISNMKLQTYINNC